MELSTSSVTVASAGKEFTVLPPRAFAPERKIDSALLNSAVFDLINAPDVRLMPKLGT